MLHWRISSQGTVVDHASLIITVVVVVVVVDVKYLELPIALWRKNTETNVL